MTSTCSCPVLATEDRAERCIERSQGGTVIKKVVETWHWVVAGQLSEALNGLLADDGVFYLPIVYTPQRGNAVTTMYLRTAAETLFGDSAHGAFHYTRQVLADDVARLEFETMSAASTSIASTSSACDETGRIVEFRVMIRPLQAIDAVHEPMRAMFASMQPRLHPDERWRSCCP
jgi:hypothetical protein